MLITYSAYLATTKTTLLEMDLKGMVAIVTGGAGGIGTELCKSLISRGVKVGTQIIQNN